MQVTMDAAGRLVIPKTLRDRLGLRPGDVEIEVAGAELRLRPIARDELEQQDGFLVVPASQVPVTEQLVQALRDADRR